MRRVQLGELSAVMAGGVDGDGGGDGPAVVLLHGFGAPGDDLVVLARALSVPRSIRFVFPAAPLSLDYGFGDSRAWWMIDLARLQRRAAGVAAPPPEDEVPAGLASAREKVLALLDELERAHGVRPESTVLGGFSQGAMLSLDVVLRDERKFAGLVLLSGTLIARSEWAPRMAARAGLPVFQSHGRDDEILQFAQAEKLRGLLAAAGLAVQWVPFRGGHAIPPEALRELGGFLRGLPLGVV